MCYRERVIERYPITIFQNTVYAIQSNKTNKTYKTITKQIKSILRLFCALYEAIKKSLQAVDSKKLLDRKIKIRFNKKNILVRIILLHFKPKRKKVQKQVQKQVKVELAERIYFYRE